jgi:hypothetical protein
MHPSLVFYPPPSIIIIVIILLVFKEHKLKKEVIMKKYILGITMVSLLAITNVGIAMEKAGMPKTSLSAQEVAELRKAIIDYKNDRSRAKQEKIIKKYQDKYPNDPFVKSKMSEKARFENSKQPPTKKESVKPQVKKEPAKVMQKKERPAVSEMIDASFLAKIDDISLNTMNIGSYRGIPLYISKKELTQSGGKPLNLKKLFDKYNLCQIQVMTLDPWSEEDWELAYSVLEERATQVFGKLIVVNSLDKLPQLLIDAKTVVKSFLLTDDKELPYIQEHFIKKTGLNRLFTYAKLQRVIEKEKLTHIRLPRKILTVRDQKSGKYVSSKEASKIIDNGLRVCIDNESLRFQIRFDSTKYELVIFAHKESNAGTFSAETKEELSILCKESPFDVGFGNIFSDTKGDAIVIDTEYKGETVRDCAKLSRYQ